MTTPTPAKPLRIGLDGCCFVGNPTGIPNYVYALLRGMSAEHPDVTFHSLSNETTRELALPNLVSRVSVPRRRGPIWQNTQLVDMIRRDRIDVFWGTNGVIPLRGLGDTASVVTIHDLAHRYVPETQLPMIRWKQRVFQSLCARAADRVVTVSEATGRDVQRYYRRKPDAVIHPVCGPDFRRIDPATAAATADALGLPQRFLLSVGTLEPRKNIASLIEAYWACIQDGVALPPLILIGSRGWFDGRLRDLIDMATEAGSLRYLGYVQNEVLAHLYARCAMFVMPSLYEGFGMPILEAQACGAPVVHGTHPSMAEAAGGLGVQVDPTVAGIRGMLERFARDELPLACRDVAADCDDERTASRRMWQVIVDAWRSKRAVA